MLLEVSEGAPAESAAHEAEAEGVLKSIVE
jgi:hypothetical protein